MTHTTYPATWPGTAIIKSTHTAFNWRQTGGHDQFSARLACPTDRTPLYNQWLNARAEHPRSTQDWPQYRDTHTTRVRRGHKKNAGIAHNNGAIAGLSNKADKRLAVRHCPGPQLNTLGAAKTSMTTPGATGPHGGAYSKAAPGPAAKVVPAHLVRPAGAKPGRARKVAA